MYNERFIQYKNQILFNLERINNKSILIVFFHGLGDSHLNYRCFFQAKQLEDYDLFVADLLGYGKSGNADNYSFANQMEALSVQLDSLLSNYKKIIFVPHSMGGIYATLLASNQFLDKITAVYAVEISLTQESSPIANKIDQIINKAENFYNWFQFFSDEKYMEGINNESIRNYYIGLELVNKTAFIENAIEMHSLPRLCALNNQNYTKIAELFVKLPITKVYCLGDKGLHLFDVPFLSQHSVHLEYFPTDCHWVAQSCLDDFIERLNKFIENL